MKRLFLALLISGSLSAFAQTKESPMIKQIQPSVITGSSKAVVVDNAPLAHTAQLLPLNKNGKVIGKGNISKQVDQVFKNIVFALKLADSDVDKIVKINIYISRNEFKPEIEKQLGSKFKKGIKPAVSFVTGDLANQEADIAIDVIAVSNLSSDKVRYFHSPATYGNSLAAHVAVLPAAGVTYVSGQADKGDLTEATRGTIKQLEATIKHLGIAKEQVIQIKCFVQPMSDISIVEKEFARFFEGQTVPPMVFVNWISQNPVIEIELIAASPASTSKPDEQLSFITPPGMTASPVYSKVTQINHGKKIYISGIYGNTINDAGKQTAEIFQSLKEILSESGSDFAHLAKATYYVSDNTASVALNDIRPGFYDPKRPPAASKAMVKGVGINGMSINIDMIGVVKQ
jgi:enamine deaminase RidA (YjgF/YER057c/UK114 family)